MRRFALVAVPLLLAGRFAPAAFAQEHGQIGSGADYFRLPQTKMDFAGAGGHLSVNTNRNLQLEAARAMILPSAWSRGSRTQARARRPCTGRP
jgi:hypothetical protein